jgi:SAM-dependent methyltransferase
MDPDSEFLYERMRQATFDALALAPGQTAVDSAAGLGNDARTLAERGITTTNVEPSVRITGLTALIAEKQQWKDWGRRVKSTRAWSEALPFRAASFDAAFCKGSIDHFGDPERSIAEMARVTRPTGRVVVSVANFNSLGCRILRLKDRVRGERLGSDRKHYHVPPDHFTRFDLALISSQFARHAHVDEVIGVSLFWGLRGWARLILRLPASVSGALLRLADAVARLRPGWADIIVIAGRPRGS